MSDPKQFYYTAVLAEVEYTRDGKQPEQQKIQFFTQNESPNFPIQRMQGLQQSAIHTLREAKVELGEIRSVWILSLLPLGCMSEAEFNAPGVTLSAAPEEPAPAPQKPRLVSVPKTDPAIN